jgi:hypothetical protein
MALKKSIELENGMIAEYWKIVKISFINKSLKAIVDLELWKDKDVRGEGSKLPVKTECLHVELESLNCDIFPTCYSKIKLLENFTGAEDV